MNIKRFTAVPGRKFRLKDHDPAYTGKLTKKEAKRRLKANIRELRKLQNRLFSQGTRAALLIFQGLDASGKDSAIEHVLLEVKPVGFGVTSFKTPNSEELEHDYLWRHVKVLPRRGRIGVFNRSYYEEVLVVRVHPEFLEKQHLPPDLRKRAVWKRRFREINNFEKFLADNGIVVMKFFLNVSREEQMQRFDERRRKPSKRWKFSLNDVREMKYRPRYMRCYQSAISNTSTPWAPWHIVPADNKWFSRVVISEVIIQRLQSLGLKYPELSADRIREMRQAKRMLKT